MRTGRALGLALVVAACGGPASAPALLGVAWPRSHEGMRFAVLGDVQRTSKPELLAMREANDPERRRILEAVAESAPDFVAFTGDLVFDGARDGHWAEFDALTAPIRSRRIPVLTAFGNHEYWEGRVPAERNVFARFPVLERRHWYAFLAASVLLVVLDSNVGELTRDEWKTEHAWYETTLAAADGDPAVRGVLVLLHHPPFTNSTVTGDEAPVEQAFVPAFLAAHKTLAMLAGHVHSYERFAKGGKMFVVSGGGGGPRALLASGAARRHPDDLFDGPPLRDFHFTVYAVGPDGLDAEVHGLRKGSRELYPMDHFTLPFAARN
jgi:hypothetical protein